MEPVGLAIGVLGIAGLFKSCIDNFDIVVKAREFGADFDLLCTQLSLQRIRLVLWGETLGLTPESSTPFNPLLNRQDIGPSIESALCHLQLLLQKADVVTDRYEIQGDEADDQAVADLHSHQSVGLNIFRERFELLKGRLRRNQKEKSTWTVTRWAVHDLPKFKEAVANIRELLDDLEGITSTLGVLQQQQALLAQQIESISDTQSLRLLQQVTSSDGASASLRLASETASIRLSLLDDPLPAGAIRSTKTSYYTAVSHFGATSIQHSVILEEMEPSYPPALEHLSGPSEPTNTGNPVPGISEHQQQQRDKRLFNRVKQRVEGLPILSPFTRMQTLPLRSANLSKVLTRPANISKEPSRVTNHFKASTKLPVAMIGPMKPTTEVAMVSSKLLEPAAGPAMPEESHTTVAESTAEDLKNLPQNQRLMAELVKRSTGLPPSPSFTSGSVGYGDALASIRVRNDEMHSDHSLRLLLHADNDNGTSAARRAFLELRSLRKAAVPFITASLMEDRLDRLIASIEGPLDTPYQGGVFWILVKLPPQPTEPPILRFVTKIYHPNVDCNGNICADYQSWWKDPNLQRYMNGFSAHRRDNTPWFSDDRWNRYSLGALLTALCSLLASPNILDPLVPEIAATYVQNYTRYCENAQLYTQRYALQERPSDIDLDKFDQETGSLVQVCHDSDHAQMANTGLVASSSINIRAGSLRSEVALTTLSPSSDSSIMSLEQEQDHEEEPNERWNFDGTVSDTAGKWETVLGEHDAYATSWKQTSNVSWTTGYSMTDERKTRRERRSQLQQQVVECDRVLRENARKTSERRAYLAEKREMAGLAGLTPSTYLKDEEFRELRRELHNVTIQLVQIRRELKELEKPEFELFTTCANREGDKELREAAACWIAPG